jgi:hypothetical protein
VLVALCWFAVVALADKAPAQQAPQVPAAPSNAVLELEFTPVARAQIAIWIERGGEFITTLRLTEAVNRYGVGNRPGASQMNSGFRWPYGRREGVLPIWAALRARQPGARQFRRVIFQNRTSEGYAARTSEDYTPDAYYCLSFDVEATQKDALDAVTCPSLINSDKGRFITEADVQLGYAEPYEVPVTLEQRMRPLSLDSWYPPRRDLVPCQDCRDHPDAALFKAHAEEVMPELDAISMATPVGDVPQQILHPIPHEWPAGDYRACLEINVEGDHNATFGPDTHPTPALRAGWWDDFSTIWGYPYRGQPSVVYCAEFTIAGDAAVHETRVSEPVGSAGGWDAIDPGYGELRPMTGVTDDPAGAPGSGADRLHRTDGGDRLIARVRPASECAANVPPTAVMELAVRRHDDPLHAHEYAALSFRAAGDDRAVHRYEVRVALAPITDELSFMAGVPAKQASSEAAELLVPTAAAPGELVEVALGGLTAQTHHHVAVRAVDGCAAAGPIATAEITTTERKFTTVTPCFIATAAWDSPLAAEIGTLRRFRDRHLASTAPGRLLVSVYERVGPVLADFIRPSEARREAVRRLLRPLIAFVERIDAGP